MHTQAEVLTGLPVTDLVSGRTAVEALQGMGPRCVVLTLGEKGLLYSQLLRGGQWTGIQHIEAEVVEVVDTTVSERLELAVQRCSLFRRPIVQLSILQGAGDAFVGALACYLSTHQHATLEKEGEGQGCAMMVEEESLGMFLKMAARVAGHTVTARGTQTSFNTSALPRELLAPSHGQ